MCLDLTTKKITLRPTLFQSPQMKQSCFATDEYNSTYKITSTEAQSFKNGGKNENTRKGLERTLLVAGPEQVNNYTSFVDMTLTW